MASLAFCSKLLLVSVSSLFLVEVKAFANRQFVCYIQLVTATTCDSSLYSRVDTTCGLQLDPQLFTELRNCSVKQLLHFGPKLLDIRAGDLKTKKRQEEENIKTMVPNELQTPTQCQEEPVYVNHGAVRKRKLSNTGYPVVIEYECDQTGEEKYKYFSGPREALCNDQGTWTLPAMICLPTSCYTIVADSSGTKSALYAGDKHQDKDGHKCQAWKEDMPYGHRDHHKLHGACSGCESVEDSDNKCRDMDHGKRPWCYTTDPSVRWEYCDIPECSKEKRCARPPIIHYAPPMMTELIGQKVHVTYTCHVALQYRGGRNVSICDMETGVWTWPDLLCASEECFHYDRDQWKTTVYIGNVSTTVGGRSCQRWDSQTPHQHNLMHNLTAARIPGARTLSEHGNMCRDPQEEGAPWCFTTDPDKRWEFCPVPECKIQP